MVTFCVDIYLDPVIYHRFFLFLNLWRELRDRHFRHTQKTERHVFRVAFVVNIQILLTHEIVEIMWTSRKFAEYVDYSRENKFKIGEYGATTWLHEEWCILMD